MFTEHDAHPQTGLEEIEMRDVSEVSFRSRCAPIALALVAAAGANAGVLTTFNFQGSGAFLWNDLLAWDQGGFPNSLDHNAVIANNPGVATTLSLNTTISLNDLLYTSNDVQFINQGRQIKAIPAADRVGQYLFHPAWQTVQFLGHHFGDIVGNPRLDDAFLVQEGKEQII